MTIDKNTFNKNLLITQKYCLVQSEKTDKNKASILRTINPEVSGQRLFDFKQASTELEEKIFTTQWLLNPTEDWLPHLFEKQLVFKQVFLENIKIETTCRGKILSVQIDSTRLDGAAEVTSGGFIDRYDFPPIDTWIYLANAESGRTLYAWIPDQFVEDINNALPSDIVAIMQWIDSDSIE
jgi:hypothetical protein